MIPFLPLDQITASFQPEIDNAIKRVTHSGWYLNGGELTNFEQSFAAFTGTTHCIGTGNGFDALTLALLAMKAEYGWNDEAEVILPAMTFVATALAVVRAGLHPILADVDSNAVLTPETVLPHLSSRTRALLPVHLYGRLAPIDGLAQLAEDHHLALLEDAAQAHGATLQGRRAGAWGTMAAFSFYPGKNLGALGDAGAVTTSDEALSQRVRMLANYGARQKYRHEALGLNSRMDEIQAAILQVKLSRLLADNKHRRNVARFYDSHIHHHLVTLPALPEEPESHVWHIYPLRCPQRDALQRHLTARGIQTLIHYPFPIHLQPAIIPYIQQEDTWPEALSIAQQELSLPISPLLTPEQMKAVADAVNDFRP